jgi:hypothetical protein
MVNDTVRAEPGQPTAPAAASRDRPDARRLLQLILAACWLLDAVLQYQPPMFTGAFARMLAASASGNPQVIAAPITWSAHLIGAAPVASNTAFATTQLLIALGIAWRPTVKVALGASVAWAFAVWWLGEGFGGVLTSTASPVTGAPGGAIIYALLAVLLWPADRGRHWSSAAERTLGRFPPRVLWLLLWGSLGLLSTGSPLALSGTIAGMAAGQPRWIASMDATVANLLAHEGGAILAVLAVLFAIIAAGVLMPEPAARTTLVLAVIVAMAIWIAGQNFGGLFAGGSTDPNTGPLLALVAAAYWPVSSPAGGR